jgi:hypothetical protein
MGDNLVPFEVVEGLSGLLLQVEVSEIIVHDASQMPAPISLIPLPSQHD